MKVISLLCPTRERPESAVRYLDSIFSTAGHPERCDVWFYIDKDDPCVFKYTDLFMSYKIKNNIANGRCHTVIGPRKSVSISWNDIAKRCTGDILVMGNDDIVFKTHNWDDRLEEEALKYPDEIYCLFFHDTIHNNPTFCAFPMVSRKWYEALGYFTPGVFKFQYNDTWISDIADRIGRKQKIIDVTMEHRHWKTPKGKEDGTIEHTIARDTLESDGIIFNHPDMVQKRIEDAEKLRSMMK